MRALTLAILVLAAGCGSQPVGSTGGYDQFGCKIGCDKCPPQTLCVGVPYVPACLVQCLTTADCDPGFLCAVITVDFGPGVCLGPASLMLCDPPMTCGAALECQNATTQLKPLPAGFHTCGWERIHCDSGCDSATGSCK
jgi:hypothetical protein